MQATSLNVRSLNVAFFFNSLPSFFLQRSVHPGAGILHYNGVLPLRAATKHPEGRGSRVAIASRLLGEANSAWHAISSFAQNHPSRPEKPQVSILWILVVAVAVVRVAVSESSNYNVVGYTGIVSIRCTVLPSIRPVYFFPADKMVHSKSLWKVITSNSIDGFYFCLLELHSCAFRHNLSGILEPLVM